MKRDFTHNSAEGSLTAWASILVGYPVLLDVFVVLFFVILLFFLFSSFALQ